MWVSQGENLSLNEKAFVNPGNLANAVGTCNNAMHVLVSVLVSVPGSAHTVKAPEGLIEWFLRGVGGN